MKKQGFWFLLWEPLICGGRLDVCSNTMPGLMGVLCRTKTVILKQLVDAAGPALTDAQAVSSVLGVHSVRLVRRGLELWRQKLSVKERSLLLRHSRGGAEPDPTDAFPDLHLSLGSEEPGGPLLKIYNQKKLSLHSADKQTIYRNTVKATNTKGLFNRAATVWTDRLGGQSPQWRTLYKPPLKKRTGDLQWRILHGAIATNAFLSVFNSSVVNECPFCSLSETIFHVFTECRRLTELFSVLTGVFNLFNVVFSASVFIGGVTYTKEKKAKCQLLNFLLGEAKLAVYLTRRDKLQDGPTCDVVALWRQSVKARLRLEFCFHKATENMDVFKEQWGCDQALCRVSGRGELTFSSHLN